MLIPFSITAISGTYPDIAADKNRNLFSLTLYANVGAGRVGISIFYPSGEPISLQRLHRSPGRLGRLAVVHYSFMGHFFTYLECRVGWVGLDS